MIYKALTIKPEYADLILSGAKRIENRSWGENVRGTILLHRGGKGGAIVAAMEIVDVITPEEALSRYPEQAPYISGPLCWVIGSVTKIKPVPCRGSLSLWKIEMEVIMQSECVFCGNAFQAANDDDSCAACSDAEFKIRTWCEAFNRDYESYKCDGVHDEAVQKKLIEWRDK